MDIQSDEFMNYGSIEYNFDEKIDNKCCNNLKFIGKIIISCICAIIILIIVLIIFSIFWAGYMFMCYGIGELFNDIELGYIIGSLITFVILSCIFLSIPIYLCLFT